MEKICQVSDVPKGSMKGFTVKDRQILIANVDGNFYAMDAICSHMRGFLPGGTLENNEVVCPVHHARFDVTTGKVIKNLPAPLKMLTGGGAKNQQSFRVTLKEGAVFIDL